MDMHSTLSPGKMRCVFALACISLVGASLIETPMSLLSNPTSPLGPQPQRVTGYFELNTTHAGSMFYWYGVLTVAAMCLDTTGT